MNSTILDNLSPTKKSIIVTGDRPTGPLHLGHYVGSLANRINLQHEHDMFILIADTQVLNNDITKAKEVKKNIIEVMRDYLSVGLEPQKIHFFLQSEIPELFELTNYFSNIATLSQVQRIPTIKAENEMYNSVMSMGFLNYPISQTADIALFCGELVPVGIDQLPILEFGNDLIERFHYHFKCNIFNKIKPLLSNNPKLLGIDGNQKMSKSLNNSIMLGDNEKTVNQKIHQMYTDPTHIKVSDPGKIEGNVVFMFLDIFHNDLNELEELKNHYQRGGLGDMVLKKLLMKDINEFLEPIRIKRNSYSDSYLKSVLEEGTKKSQSIAKSNMQKIKEIIFQ
jgi:tryptophanyl-tRNA synthetase